MPAAVIVLCVCPQTVDTFCFLLNHGQVEGERAKVSEKSTKMYNEVLDAHEKTKDLDEDLKTLTKELQTLNKEKEAVEKQRTEAIKKHTQLELDVKDIQEKISADMRTKVDTSLYYCIRIERMVLLHVLI